MIMATVIFNNFVVFALCENTCCAFESVVGAEPTCFVSVVPLFVKPESVRAENSGAAVWGCEVET